jgi:hypothetical protein
MPIFYFNIRDGADSALDPEGSELPSLASALREAREAARELLVDDIKAGRNTGGKFIEMADQHGTVVGTVILRDLLE